MMYNTNYLKPDNVKLISLYINKRFSEVSEEDIKFLLSDNLVKLKKDIDEYKAHLHMFLKHSTNEKLIMLQIEYRINFNIYCIEKLKKDIRELETKKKKTEIIENDINKLKNQFKNKKMQLYSENALNVIINILDYIDDFDLNEFEILSLNESDKSRETLKYKIYKRIDELYKRFFYIVNVKLKDGNEHWFFVIQEDGINITVFDSVGLNDASQNIFSKFINDTENDNLVYYRNDITLLHNTNCCEIFTIDILFSLLRYEIFNLIIKNIDRFYKLSDNSISKNLKQIYKGLVPKSQYSYYLPEILPQLFSEEQFKIYNPTKTVSIRLKPFIDKINELSNRDDMFKFGVSFYEIHTKLLENFANSLINIQANSKQTKEALINIYYFLDNSESYLDKNLTSMGLKPTETEFNDIKSLINKLKEFKLDFQESLNNYYSIFAQVEKQGVTLKPNELEIESNKLVFEHIFKDEYNIDYEQFCILNNIIESIKNSSIYIQFLNKYSITDFSNPNAHAKLGIAYHDTILFRSRIFNNNDIISNYIALSSDEIIFQNMLGRFARLQGLPVEENHYFNNDQQAMLVPYFIDSITLTRLNEDNNVVFGYNENIRDITPDFDTTLETGGHINFIYTLGTMDNLNVDAGVHYVAGQIFTHNGVMTVLHYDSLNPQISYEFRRFISRNFSDDVNIINVNNEIFNQNMGTNTCGIFALSAIHDQGILDRTRENYISEFINNGLRVNYSEIINNADVVQNEIVFDSIDNLNENENIAILQDGSFIDYLTRNVHTSGSESINTNKINHNISNDIPSDITNDMPNISVNSTVH